MLLTITYWLIKRLTTVYYKQTLKDDEIKYLTNAHKEDQAKLEIAYNEIDALTEINHKYSTSINAAKDAIRKLENSMNTEFSEELTNLKQMTENLSTNFDNELKTKIHINQDIQRTNVAAIDAVITYLNNLAKEDGIKLKFKTECEIKEFISNTIDASKIAMILGDHIKDAIIAINFSNNTNKNIETILRKNNETYEICISDSGIEFEIGTLLKLGTQRVTTHKKTGGTGIGFMTTFDTVKACKGSIEIQEYETDENNFKKSVVISFDGKCEYRIHSYRAEKIKVKDRDNRIVIY